MKNVLIALCWVVSLGVLSLHAESFQAASTDVDYTANGSVAASQADNSCVDADTRTSRQSPAPKRFVAINFSSPLHLPGQKPATGNGSIMPAGLSGNPQVAAATPVLSNQPLILNSDLANGPCCYEEGIQVLIPESSNHYVVSFDMASQHLGDSFNQFQLWLNDQTAPLLRFQSDYLLVLEGIGAIASFRDDHLLHLDLDLDLENQRLTIAINGERIYSGDQPLTQLQSLQFLMTIEGGATPDQVNPEAIIALDNIVVANSSYHYANLQTSVQQSSATNPRHDGAIEFVSHVKNISAHNADQVTLTHLLPVGVNVVDLHSEQMECEVGIEQIICHAAQLAPMAQADVSVQLVNNTQQPLPEVTVIATSATAEIDNYDNQVKVRMGGSGSLLLIAILLVLWMARGWHDGN